MCSIDRFTPMKRMVLVKNSKCTLQHKAPVIEPLDSQRIRMHVRSAGASCCSRLDTVSIRSPVLAPFATVGTIVGNEGRFSSVATVLDGSKKQSLPEPNSWPSEGMMMSPPRRRLVLLANKVLVPCDFEIDCVGL